MLQKARQALAMMILSLMVAMVLVVCLMSSAHGLVQQRPSCVRSVAAVAVGRRSFVSPPTSTTTVRRQTRLHASLKPQISKLIARQDLTTEETEEAWNQILVGADPAVVGAILTLLRAKGETPKEIAGMVRAMRTACNPVRVDGKLLDIVGTGGDGADTINISTASVILAAACGCKVAKAGNRSVSSRCGSADVLEMLGVRIEMTPEQVAESIEESGIGFMYAPVNHPAMKAVAPVRKALGVRTAFNLLGPMTNAAGAQRVVIGVFEENLVELMAQVRCVRVCVCVRECMCAFGVPLDA
jgi:anthranilate phosphoribosyltransferase